MAGDRRLKRQNSKFELKNPATHLPSLSCIFKLTNEVFVHRYRFYAKFIFFFMRVQFTIH